MSKDEKVTVQYHTEKLLAEAYIPMQTYDKTFDLKTALYRGTLFPELYRPYVPGKR